MKLLIIEDDHLFSSSLKRRLVKNGFTCFIANDRSQALLLCKQEVPSFILLDMHLGEDSGLQLIKALKAGAPDARLILLTGYASIATAVEAIKLGADDYLAKPVDTNTLVSTILDKKVTCSEVEEVTPLTAERMEWEHIQQVLKANDGNVSAAARQLSMHRRTLQRKLKKRPNT